MAADVIHVLGGFVAQCLATMATFKTYFLKKPVFYSAAFDSNDSKY